MWKSQPWFLQTGPGLSGWGGLSFTKVTGAFAHVVFNLPDKILLQGWNCYLYSHTVTNAFLSAHICIDYTQARSNT